MLSENIRAIRKSKGLSQEELAVKLNVVRQTISKWEQGLSVPDADLLIALAEVFETPVNTLLGETVVETKANDLQVISEKLEVINLQLALGKAARRKAVHWFFLLSCAAIVAVFAFLVELNSSYLAWNFGHPETAIAGAILHAFEWLFVRIAPFALVGALVGACLTRKKG